MKFEIDDDMVLRVSALATAAWAVPLAMAPKKMESQFMTEKAGSSPEVVRHLGTSLGYLSLHQGAVSMADEASKDAKKNVLKAAGVSWAACFAHQLYNVQRGYQKQDFTYAALTGHAAMAALCLWRGFAEDED